jgi:DNA-binding MarR family transcriptional regulator
MEPPLPERLSYLLGTLYRQILDTETRQLEPLGITIKQHAVLGMLVSDGPMTQQHIGERLGIDRTTIVKVVDGLEEPGFAERRRDPADRRAFLVAATGNGRAAAADGQRRVRQAEHDVLTALSEPERRTLADLLAKAAGAKPGTSQ